MPAGSRKAGVAMLVASSAANQTGAAFGAMAFPVIGPVGVVAIRQVVAAVVLMSIARPRLSRLRRDQWLPVLGLSCTLIVMNLSLYSAIDRIGLGLAVTLEFLGPLAVAVAASRRAGEIFCAVLAGIGVVVLTNPGPSTDVIGVGLALLAAAAWAAYILLNRILGQRVSGLQGTATASLASAIAWTPVALIWFYMHEPTLIAVLLGVVCALMSSVVPCAVDLMALRRVSAGLFGTLASINPVWAAVAGWVLLGQALQLHEYVGAALIVVSNVIVSARAFPSSRPAALPRDLQAQRAPSASGQDGRSALV